MIAPGIAVFSVGVAVVLLACMVRLAHWLDRRGEKARDARSACARHVTRAVSEEDHNPGGPLTARQARRLFEEILQSAIRQKADEILIDRLSGRPQVRLRLEGAYQELTGIGAGDSFRRLADAARSSAGLPGADVCLRGSGSFLRLYRKPHLDTDQWRREQGEDVFSYRERPRRNRVVHFALEIFPAPGGEALQIYLRPATTVEETRFDLGFAREAEDKFVRAGRLRMGIVLLTGPCNSGKSTATYRLLSLLRDEGRRIITVEWPVEWKLRGIEQNDLGDGLDAYDRVGSCLKQAIGAKPDVLLLQNIDWVNDGDARAAIDFAAGGGLLITAVHSQGCIWGLKSLLMRHFTGQRQDAASLLLAVVAPRRLSMACGNCAEELRVPAKIFRQSGMSDPPEGNDGRVATWLGHGCSLCQNTGELGYAVVYEVLDFTGEMRRFIDNRNDWDWDQLKYLERQAWQRGMRTQRELALERVVAGDISLQEALLNTIKPAWLTEAQAQKRNRSI